MTNLNDTLVDGPWTDEPDEEFFTHQGTHCLVLRHSSMGFVNGYIQVVAKHPWFELDGDALQALVHGGLTYSTDHPPVKNCKEKGLMGWWVGFDTGHSDDVTPDKKSYTAAMRGPIFHGETYKTWEWVKHHTRLLVTESQAALYHQYMCHMHGTLPYHFYKGDILKLTYPGYSPQFYRYREQSVERWHDYYGWEECGTIQKHELKNLVEKYETEIIPLDTWKCKMAMREMEIGEQL